MLTGKPPRLFVVTRTYHLAHSAICACDADNGPYRHFSYYTSTMLYSDLPSAIYAGCLSKFPSSSSTLVSVRDPKSNQGTQVTGPLTMWAQPISVQYQATDRSFFVSATTTQPATGATATATSTSDSGSADSGSSGLSTGGKIGVGVGVGVGGLAIFALLAFWFLRRRSGKKNAAPAMAAAPPYAGPYPSQGAGTYYGPVPATRSELENTSTKFTQQQTPAELQGSDTRRHNHVAELSG